MSVTRILFVFVSVLCLCAVPPAQERGSVQVPQVQRDTVEDDDGLLQWEEYQAPACPECRGLKDVKCPHCDGLVRAEKCVQCDMTKMAACRTCAGSGEPPDPFEKSQCPACMGNGVHPCDRCGNEGSFVLGDAARPRKCSCCKGEGGFPCDVCKGKGLVPSVKVKRSTAEADLEDLNAAREKLDEALDNIKAMTLTDKWRDDVETYGDAIKPAARLLPYLRKCEAAASDLLKRLTKEDSLTNAPQSRSRALNRFRTHNQVYLMVQMQVIDLCIARQEHNQEVLAEKEK